MARPQKSGMDYFPHDTDARNDLKIRKLRAVFGNDGYATYFILLENIYRSKEYFIDISDAETLLILSEECRLSEEKFTQIMLKCIDLDLFSRQEHEEHKKLTSESIKKRTEPVENKRKKNNEYYNSEKREVSDAETNTETNISDAEIPAESTQRKEKESKENIKDIYIAQSEELWKLYPEKKGKQKVMNKLPKLIEQYTYEQIERCIRRYIKDVEERRKTFPGLNYQNGSTFFNGTYTDYLDKNYPEQKIIEIPQKESGSWGHLKKFG